MDPYDYELIGKAILTVVNDKEIRNKMIATGADYANNFREDVIAGSYIKLYSALLK